MKAAIVLCVAALPVLAMDVNGNKLTLSDAEMAMCDRSGGCTLVTNRSLNEIRQALEVMLVELERRPKTCKRGEFV